MRVAVASGLALLFIVAGCSDDEALDDEGQETGETEGYGPARGELEITGIEVSQSVVQPIYVDGTVVDPTTYGVPLVPNRHMWVRALWDPPLEWTPRPLIARLHVEYPDGSEQVIPDRETQKGSSPIVVGKSTADDLLSGFYWRLAAEDVVPGMRYSVTVVEPEPAFDIPKTTGKTRWPRDKNTALPVSGDPAALNLYIVGVHYDVPGCSTDTSVLPEAEIEAIRSGFEVWSGIETNSVTIDTSLSVDIGTQTDVLSLLGVVGPIRAEYADIPDAFFLILLDDCSVVPDGILGVAPVNSDPPVLGEASMRYGAGLWNPNDIRESVNTAVHEVGHAQGALHAPCGGAAGPDPLYPHPNATLGARGLDPLTAQFYAPEAYTDFMSYCRPYWISDYRFTKSYNVQRMLTAWAGADMPGPSVALPDGYTGSVLTGIVQAGGESQWWVNANPMPPVAKLGGELRVSVRTGAGEIELATDTRLLPDVPEGRLVQVPLVDGVAFEDVVGIDVQAVHGGLTLEVDAGEIRDARALEFNVRG
ncbi:hypothetical protein DB30_02190 [Enhygromyxa salina]|uniref:Uncharacterized protein n=1 Tax=Enhygromyxa salina TaxID=215803 RepID=A0A0C2D8M5_9BACT|nr:hypothetical protein [Enhygromyxa salina]KIG17975.1 hypothetical protein DB30_02190 [Enhygromyxa salina]